MAALFSGFIYHLYYIRIHTRFDIPRLVALFYDVRANLGLRGFNSFIPRDLSSRMGLVYHWNSSMSMGSGQTYMWQEPSQAAIFTRGTIGTSRMETTFSLPLLTLRNSLVHCVVIFCTH